MLFFDAPSVSLIEVLILGIYAVGIVLVLLAMFHDNEGDD